MLRHTRTRILIVLLLAAAVAGLLLSGWHHLLTLETLKSSHAYWLVQYHAQPWLFIAGFILGATAFFSLPLPGGSLLLLAAGSIFGWVLGFVVIMLSAVAGACIAFLCARLLIGGYIQRRFASHLVEVNRGIDEEGALYVFALHLVPFIPFGIINWVMGLAPLRLHIFAIASAFGLVPGVAIIVAAGTQLATIEQLSDIFSPGVLLALTAIGVLPLLARRFLVCLRRAPS